MPSGSTPSAHLAQSGKLVHRCRTKIRRELYDGENVPDGSERLSGSVQLEICSFGVRYGFVRRCKNFFSIFFFSFINREMLDIFDPDNEHVFRDSIRKLLRGDADAAEVNSKGLKWHH